jgi:hypothetical protein
VSGGDEDTEDEDGPETGIEPLPFEGVLDRGVPMIDLVSLDGKETRKKFQEALGATEYWDVPANARVLTGPYWGAAECKIRTTTQKGFYSEESVREYYGRANKVYRVQVDPALGFWKVWLGDKQ